MNVFAYVRVSGKSQVEGDGFERQEATIKKFCETHGLTITGAWQEQGVSGTVEGLDRPAFSELIEYTTERTNSPADRIEAVVVERMDRLARDLMVSEVLLRECRNRGLKVFAADQGALIDMAGDGDDPTRKLIRQIMGALAEWEKSALVKKLRAARERTGHLGGNKAFGVKPGEDRIFQYILQAHNGGSSYREIAHTLQSLEVPTRAGTPWDPRTIQRMVQRRINAATLHPSKKGNVVVNAKLTDHERPIDNHQDEQTAGGEGGASRCHTSQHNER